MPISLAQLRFNVVNLKGGGRTSDDERLSERQVDFMIAYIRALLIRRDYEKGRSLTTHIEQDLGCVPLELVDPADCCDVETGCTVLRTVDPIPVPIEVYDRELITYVGHVDKIHSFDEIPPSRARWVGNNKYTAKGKRWYYLGEHIYVIDSKDLKFINIRGIWENPADAAAFNHCSGADCFSDTSEYPIASWMVQPLTDMIMKGEVKESLIFPQDNKNDASGNTAPNAV